MELALKTMGIAIFSISMLISFGLTSNQAFAGFETCEQCDTQFDQCTLTPQQCRDQLNSCRELLPTSCVVVAGSLTPIDTTMVLLGATQTTASWMIPVIVAGIGFAIVIARKF